MKPLFRTLFLAVALLLTLPAALAAATCFEWPIGTADRNMGHKGLDLNCDNFPLDLTAASATVTFSISGGPGSCTKTTESDPWPDPGECSFFLTQLFDPGDTIRVLYGGILPPGEDITVDIAGAEDVTNTAVAANWFFTTTTAEPRDPVAIELVFDISGSMGWMAADGGTVTRMNALKSASEAFFALLEDYTRSGDQLGLVYFSNTASAYQDGTYLQDATDAAKVGALAADLLGQSPTNSTSIGAGLEKAKSVEGLGGVTLPSTEKYILLFSDGEQNRPPTVAVSTSPDQLTLDGVLYPIHEITICPITAGRQTAAGFALQQSIADVACDTHNAHLRNDKDTFVEADLETFFLQDLMNILLGDKLEMVLDETGTLTQGEILDRPFPANPDDLLMTVLLSWTAPRVKMLPFELIAPSGDPDVEHVVDLRGVRTRGGKSFVTLRLPAAAGGARVPTAGEWKVRLRGDDLAVDTTDFHLAVMLDNARLATEFSTVARDPGTGESFALEARLREAGAPVEDALVTVYVHGPNEGQGEILSNAPTPNLPPGGGEPDEPNAAALDKLQALLEDPAYAELFGDKGLPDVVLTQQAPGTYRGVFDRALEEGHYQFVFEARATGAVNGDYRRTWRETVFVRPKPDPKKTEFMIVDVQPGDPSGNQPPPQRVTFQTTAFDALGNHLGPGYLGSMRIDSALGTPLGTLVDRLDGSYIMTWEIGHAENPRITLEILGEEVLAKPLESLPGADLLERESDWRFSLAAGWTEPHGLFGTVADGSYSLAVGAERRMSDRLSLEILLGNDRFDVGRRGFGQGDVDLTHLSLQARWTFPGGELGGKPLRPWLHVGVGGYAEDFDDIFLGWNAGGGLQLWVRPRTAIELIYNFRNVDGGALEYETLQLGERFKL